MNYCTKCQSIYAQPGTCNCYAVARPPVYPWAPTYPYPTWIPYTPTTPTITWDVTTNVPPNGTTWYVKASALPDCQPITSGYSAPVVT